MKFSVVIPAYNAVATIVESLRSVVRQSRPAHEIIVVDDGSTDETAAVVRSFPSDVPLRLLQMPQNKGVSAARNTGWAAATGTWVAFLDSDDRWHPDKLKVMASYLAHGQEVQVLFHPYTLGVFPPISNPEVAPLTVVGFRSFLLRNLAQSSCIAVVRQLDIRFDPEFRYCEDHEFMLRAASRYVCGQITIALTCLDRAQSTRGGLSGDLWKMRRGELKMYSRIARYKPLWVPIIPILWALSLAKHFRKLLLLRRI